MWRDPEGWSSTQGTGPGFVLILCINPVGSNDIFETPMLSSLIFTDSWPSLALANDAGGQRSA